MSEDALRRWMEANRLNWDDRTAIHLRNSSGFYAIDRVKAGDDLFHGCEDAELGEVTGKRLVHLQCPFGLDTIRLARRGATATGLDFSAPALAAARALAAELGVAARFVEGNVYDAPSLLEGEAYDIAFVTWGAIIWLPDIRRWAQIVAGLLAPGGWLYLAEGHPSTLSLEEVDGRLVASGSWRTEPATPFIIGALLDSGLRLDFLHEHETLPWRHFPMMVSAGERLYRLPDGHPRLPLAFSLRASKPD